MLTRLRIGYWIFCVGIIIFVPLAIVIVTDYFIIEKYTGSPFKISDYFQPHWLEFWLLMLLLILTHAFLLGVLRSERIKRVVNMLWWVFGMSYLTLNFLELIPAWNPLILLMWMVVIYVGVTIVTYLVTHISRRN